MFVFGGGFIVELEGANGVYELIEAALHDYEGDVEFVEGCGCHVHSMDDCLYAFEAGSVAESEFVFDDVFGDLWVSSGLASRWFYQPKRFGKEGG